jgi:hypothetical protein
MIKARLLPTEPAYISPITRIGSERTHPGEGGHAMTERVRIPSPVIRRRREANRRLVLLAGALLIALGAAALAPSVSEVGKATWAGALRLVSFEMPNLTPGKKHTMLRVPVERLGIHPERTGGS